MSAELDYVPVVRTISVGRPAGLLLILALRFLTGLPWAEAVVWGLLTIALLDFRLRFPWRWS